jgi:hypothetical protein
LAANPTKFCSIIYNISASIPLHRCWAQSRANLRTPFTSFPNEFSRRLLSSMYTRQDSMYLLSKDMVMYRYVDNFVWKIQRAKLFRWSGPTLSWWWSIHPAISLWRKLIKSQSRFYHKDRRMAEFSLKNDPQLINIYFELRCCIIRWDRYVMST